MTQNTKFPLPVTGIDMLSTETAMSKGSVRIATNVDIERSGAFKRRVGRSIAKAGANYHSIYSAPQRGSMFVCNGVSLNRLQPDMTETPVATLNSPDPVSYVEYNGNLYWTNSTTTGWLPVDGGVARPIGVPGLPVTPTPTVVSGGLLPGRYTFVFTRLDDRREESGATDPIIVDLPNGGGVRFSGFPLAIGTVVRIYMSDPDGEVPHVAAEVPGVFPTYTVTESARGGDCTTKYLRSMPPGDFITWMAGRLYTAKNDTLYFSDALRPHLYNPAHNFIKFSGFISFVEPVTDGLYVGDSRGVWFLSGLDPTKFTQSYVSSNRAVVGSAIRVPAGFFDDRVVQSPNTTVAWLGVNGYSVGQDSGTITNLQDTRIRLSPGLRGKSVLVVRDGIKQLITPVNTPAVATSGTAIDSTINNEVQV